MNPAEETLLEQWGTLYEKIFHRGEALTLEKFLEKTAKEREGGQGPLTAPTALLRAFWENIHHLAFLEPFFSDPSIREIILHGSRLIQLDRQGTLQDGPSQWPGHRQIQMTLEIFALKNQISWNYSQPFASFHWKKGEENFRATLIHHCLTPQKESKLFLRKFPSRNFPLEDFGGDKDGEQVRFLLAQIQFKKNMLICGATSSGKTALLGSLLAHIPAQEHVVILEDTHEIYSSLPSRTHLLAQSDLAQKSLEELCSHALRLRPDRILLGEIRKDEVVPFFLSMNTGHQGLLCTLHANGPHDALSRCALLLTLFSKNQKFSFNRAMDLLCKNLDYVIYMENKKIRTIAKVLGSEKGQGYVEEVFGRNHGLD